MPNNPFGLHTVTPYLIVDGVESLIEFAQDLFSAELRGEVRFREDGSVQHAELAFGNSVIMMGEPTDDLRPMPATLYIYVDDCDRVYRDAVAAGALSILPPQDFPHGDRYGGIQDQSGNIWWVATHIGRKD